MAKPRIIIADTDISYIARLQQRFAEDFFERIDLEIITEEAYFEQAFSTPQRADVLIVSEDLYTSSLQKHNIGKIFLMTEQYEEGRTDELNVNRIFKYSSLKEIFNEIIGKSASALRESATKKTEPQIVLVYSACGGTGKTTVAIGMAACLTQNYKKVLYINASHLQSFQRLMENPGTVNSQRLYTDMVSEAELSYGQIKPELRKEQFSYLPPFKASLMSLGLDFKIYEKIALAAKKSREFDYIIVDADSEFDEEKTSLIGCADKVVVVLRQNAASVYATNLMVSSINGVNPEKYIFICNDFSAEHSNALHSPNANLRFIVNDYVEHISQYDNLKAQNFIQVSGLQRVSFQIL